jgi:hypothetical protein
VAHENTIFSQLFHFIPRHVFSRAVERLQADRYCKHFTAWQQFIVLLYAQISGKDSLRPIVGGLDAHQRRLYHLGLSRVPRSTLADALQRRPAALFEELFYAVLARARSLAPPHKFRFKNRLYSLDSTTIDLCLSVFDWARFRRRKGAIKLHFQLDHRGHLPVFLVLSEGSVHDMTIARKYFPPQPDSIYCFDRAYRGLDWWDEFQRCGAFFITRTFANQNYRVTGQHAPSTSPSILADEVVEFEGKVSHRKYPHRLRVVTFQEPETDRIFRYLTNHFRLAATTIAEIYHQRWQIEIFFRWVKQNLKIKTFLGTSRNAVLSQIWVAMIYFLLLAYFRFLNRSRFSLTTLTHRIADTLMHRVNLLEVVTLTRIPPPPNRPSPQLSLFPL